MEIRKRFGKRIKELRQARGLSHEALARLTGLDSDYISGIERVNWIFLLK